eukprot:13720176-Alexandrium_andersonii.AAC.1
MSASLVGSEMCIRDSAGDHVDWWAPLKAGLTRGPLEGRSGAVLRAPPVSYTHLTLPTICSV